jgi:hypothetical protein
VSAGTCHCTITQFSEQLMEITDGDTFELADGVTRTAVRYRNRFGIDIAGDLHAPADATGRLPALAVSGRGGAARAPHRR